MSIKKELKKLVTALGGVPSRNTIPGLIGDVTDSFKALNPLTGLDADANIEASVDLLGKVVTNLQEGITIEDGFVLGKSKYVTGYTGFSGTKAEQKGNYIALHFGVPDMTIGTDVTITVEGSQGPSTLDPDGLLVYRIKDDRSNMVITAVATKDGYTSITKKFDLSKLTLVPKE